MVLKKFLKEIQSTLPGISAKLTWTSEEGSYPQDMTGVTPFQMTFEVDEKPRTLMTDCLVIKHFLRKIIMVHPKILVQKSSNVPNLSTLGLYKDLVLPDVSYRAESSEGDQSQNMDPQGQTLLLFLFVDFHSAFPVQQMEIWGVYTLLTTHLNAILVESHSVVQGSIQFTVDQVLEQHHQAAKAQQKLQASLSVAVNSIMSILTGSTRSSFRKMCLQTLQAADTQEFETKLHKVFREITQHQFLHHCSCEVKQLTLEKKDSAQGTEDVPDNSSWELLAGTNGQAENKRLKRGSLRMEEMRALHSARAPSPSDAAPRRPEATAAPLTPSGRAALKAHGSTLAPGRVSLGSRLEDVLWLQEVSNLSEWLSPSPGP
ncbi:hypothetical protein H8959_002539 [Pygathrix nigripes]